ncbi:MAG TPA: methionine--tRNA ligase [Streptosporangiaceae bacterium]|nr:methionine--tRNA ligase [Streptosporangiaceae bacterium]
MTAIYLTTTIPYVNGRPHLGHAVEFVQADVLARHHRRAGAAVRLQTGTDDNSLKNVLAAKAAGVGVREFVDSNAAAFSDLAAQLSVSADDAIATSSDPRHRPAVERLWRACEQAGDLYPKHYTGLYCVGCEQFYTETELPGGRCAEHGTVPQQVSEENWFFRLTRYGDRLRSAITSGQLRIEPAARRNEVLGFIDGGLEDFSVSRSVGRAHGWGIPVPGDPGQVIYVWFDALGNYISALDYGTGGAALSRWWTNSTRRVHLLGKGVVRFHAVYWPAILLSAGLPLPTEEFVHDYITVDGAKIGKSAGNAIDVTSLIDDYGADALRWWLLREVAKVGDTDFTVDRLIARANDELANGIGNLVHRVVALVCKYRDGLVPVANGRELPGTRRLERARRQAAELIDSALADGDFRQATAAVVAIADEANKYISQSEPWRLVKAERGGDGEAAALLDAVLAALIETCRELAGHLAPFLPDAAERIAAQCSAANCATSGGKLQWPTPVFTRLIPRGDRGKEPVPAYGYPDWT